MRPTLANDEVPSPQMTSGVVSEDRRTIEEQENILNGIFCPEPPFSSLETNNTRIGLTSNIHTYASNPNPQAHFYPGPNPPHISIPKPLYFVTEPNENPTSPNSKSGVEHHIQTCPIISENINPNPNPMLLPAPKPLNHSPLLLRVLPPTPNLTFHHLP